MRLNWPVVLALYRTELRMVLRDRRMLFTSILLPLLITPLMFLGSSWSVRHHQQQLRELEILYAVAGDHAAQLRTLLATTPPPDTGTNASTPFHAREVPCRDPRTSLDRAEIQVVVGMDDPAQPSGTAAAPAGTVLTTNAPAAAAAARPEVEGEKRLREVPVITLTFRGDRQDSAAAMSRFTDKLMELRRTRRAELLAARGFTLRPSDLAAVREINVASSNQVAGMALGRVLTLLLMLFILSSGAVVAIDSLAGEKERGTLETLLTTAAGRLEILAAKQWAILTVALAITLIQLGNLLVYLHFKVLPGAANLSGAVTLGKAALLLLLYVPLAALAANVLLVVSGYARSYKEAQMYFLPVLFVGLIPALAPCLPGLDLRSAIVLVPVANLAVAARDILVGTFDWPLLAGAWVITWLAAAWTGRWGLRALSQESLIVPAQADPAEFKGGPALFPQRVLRWFALLWAALVILSGYTEHLDLRLQIAINLAGLFLGATCLMVWRYRLEVKETFSLRAPRPAVWLGVLLGIPGGFISALALFEISSLIIPAPREVTEAFTGALFPPHVPFYQVIFFLAVMPGFFEELTFRGLLLHGLRQRVRPVWAVLAVGLIFGLFHVALFRLVPTAFLGILFATVTLLTRSIYPAMVWHCASNALGLLAYRFSMPESGLGWSVYAAGGCLLALAFWIFWRHRAFRPPPSGRGNALVGTIP